MTGYMAGEPINLPPLALSRKAGCPFGSRTLTVTHRETSAVRHDAEAYLHHGAILSLRSSTVSRRGSVEPSLTQQTQA